MTTQYEAGFIEGLEDEWWLAEDRTPDGCSIRSLVRIGKEWEAVAADPKSQQYRRGRGPTPVAAFRALWETP